MYRGILKEAKANHMSGNCLEMGAGPGLLAVMLARQNPELNITAIDLSPDMSTIVFKLFLS
jgi:methylase of polypeptide subunit release factors